jgi:hypothetical protein
MKMSPAFKTYAGVALLLALAIPPRARASSEDRVQLFGYFEPQLTAAAVDGETQQLLSNKLRIDLEAAPSDHVTLGCNINFAAYQGHTTFDLVDYLDEDLAAAVPGDLEDSFVLTLEDGYSLDNAFLKIAFGAFDLTVGKQQISPGTGYAWNPTDMYNQKDILDPTYENPGHGAVKADIPLGARGTAELIFSPEDDADRSGKFARVKLPAGHFDISLVAGERFVTLTDFTTLSAVSERRRLAGGDFAGELLGAGIWGELAHNSMEVSDDYLECLLGSDYTFESGLYVLGEFYYNERGRSDDRYEFNDWMRFLTSEARVVTRSQIYTYVSYPATDLMSVGGSLIMALPDDSAALIPTVEYNLDTNLDLTLYGNFYLGDEGDAFSPLLGQGFLLRLRYYF